MKKINPHNRIKLLTVILPLLLIGLQGCASLRPPKTLQISGRPQEPVVFFAALEKTVDAAGVRNAADYPIPEFPYLRANRFLVAMGAHIEGPQKHNLWVRQMQELDLSARKKEIRNFPDSAIARLTLRFGLKPHREALMEKVYSASQTLFRHDQNNSTFFSTLSKTVHYPDDYSNLLRAIGLYPVSSLAVALLTHKVRSEFKIWYNTDLNKLNVRGEIHAFAPPKNTSFSIEHLPQLLKRTQNQLGFPALSPDQKRKVAAALAPFIYQDVAGVYDRPGKVFWEQKQVKIDPSNPTVYYYFTHAFFNEKPVLQINYVFWYSNRRGADAPWIEWGNVDGLTIRITLDAKGEPLMVDGMNNCGCYHFFFPPKGTLPKKASSRWEPGPFAPQRLPENFPANRLVLRINSGWHQVQRATTTRPKAPGGAHMYRLVPYDILETLPRAEKKTESVFNAKGILKGSDRIEPLLLFSTGIRDVGAMRQRGHHPIKLVGKAHFDDPYLFDKSFIFKYRSSILK
ncbi:MAG: hypothetical protein V3S66_03930 [Desulfobacterales bacterium]